MAERRFVSKELWWSFGSIPLLDSFLRGVAGEFSVSRLIVLILVGLLLAAVAQAWRGTGALVIGEHGLRIERLPGMRADSRILPWHELRRAKLDISNDVWALLCERHDGVIERVALGGFTTERLFPLIAEHVELDLSAQDTWVPPGQRPVSLSVRVFQLILLFIATGVLTFLAEGMLVRGWHPPSMPLWLAVFTMPLASFAIARWFRRDGKPDFVQDGIVGGVLVGLVLVWTAMVLNRALTEAVPLRTEQATLRLVVGDDGVRKPVVELVDAVRIGFPPYLADDFPDVQNGAVYRIHVRRGLFGDVAIMPEAVERIGEEGR